MNKVTRGICNLQIDWGRVRGASSPDCRRHGRNRSKLIGVWTCCGSIVYTTRVPGSGPPGVSIRPSKPTRPT